MVKVGDNAAPDESFHCNQLGSHLTSTGKRCCRANNIRQDNLHTWFKAEAHVMSINSGKATIILQLFFRYVFNELVEWRALRWEDLGQMHGRRVHASIVSTDLRYAWHVHPDSTGDGLPASLTELPLQLHLPEDSEDATLSVRLHLSFGVRAWAPAIQMCIDSEDVVHIDPGPNQEMMVEGEALTSVVVLRAGAAGASSVCSWCLKLHRKMQSPDAANALCLVCNRLRLRLQTRVLSDLWCRCASAAAVERSWRTRSPSLVNWRRRAVSQVALRQTALSQAVTALSAGVHS